MDDLLKRLRKIETGDGTGDHVTHWYRNPDGVEAAEEIVKLKWRAKIDANIIARLRLTAEQREAVTGMACYFYTRGNLQMQAWGSLLRILLERLR